MKRALMPALAVMAIVLSLTGCAATDNSSVSRPGQPLVLTGVQLPALVGKAPGRIVAFRHTRRDDTPRWTQIPVQIDERKVVPFGTQPPDNRTPGVTGTVYGHGGGGPAAVQYVDPTTFVGPDVDPAFDGDDELVFMVTDSGGKVRPEDPAAPPGVVAGSGVAVQMDDPQRDGQRAWVYLFVSNGSLDPSAGKDYVDYDFQLTSGDYKTTYRRSQGRNPETSRVVTDQYRIGFRDRWFEDSWQVRAGDASGVDLLDGHKNQFAIDFCGRSNATFADAEGAFVANIDGPVRAIRSYVGANSGPRTQRTHKMYRDRETIVTNLRVHAIPGVMDFVDYSAAASGMVYRSSTRPSGVRVNGAADPISSEPASWEVVNGPQGAVFTRSVFATSVDGLGDRTSWFYRDQANPPEEQCWGDDSFYAASGNVINGGIPNTDPGLGASATVTGTRTVHFLTPYSDGTRLVAAARALAADLAQPLRVTVSRHQP